jgi:hypothetical protein
VTEPLWSVSILGEIWPVGTRFVVLAPDRAHPGQGVVTVMNPAVPRPVSVVTVSGTPIAAVAAPDGTTWVVSRLDGVEGGPRAGTLVQLAPSSGKVLRRVALPQVPFSLAVAGGRIWVGLDGALFEYNPKGSDSRTWPLPAGPIRLAASAEGGRLYGVLNGPGGASVVAWSVPGLRELARRDESSGRYFTSLALGFGGVYVTSVNKRGGEGALQRLDPRFLLPLEPGAAADTGDVTTIHSGAGAMWLEDTTTSTVSCFIPTTSDYRLGQPVQVPDALYGNAGDIAPAGGHLVVAQTARTIAFGARQSCNT